MKLKEYMNISKHAEILHITKYEILFCVAYFVLALAIGLYSTPKGYINELDGTFYILQAEGIYSNHNILIAPPIYPALVAIGMVLGLTSEQSAGIVPIICYSLLGFPLFLLGKIISRPMTGYMACIICLLCSKYLLYISSHAWTDTPYLLFSIFAILFLAIYNRYGYLSSINIAGIFTLIAILTRYLGITLILVGLITVIINNKDIKKSLKYVVDYCSISVIPLIAWVLITPPSGYTITASSIKNPPIDVIIHKFITYLINIFYDDYKIIVLIAILCTLISLLHIYINNRLIIFFKDTIPLIGYISLYSIILIFATSSSLISSEGSRLTVRYVIQLLPFIVLLITSIFIYAYDGIKIPFYRIIFKAVSIILLICLIAQGANSLYVEANEIRRIDIANYSDRDRFSKYLSEQNVTADNKIYLDYTHDGNMLYMEAHMKHPNIPLGRIPKTIHSEWVLENLIRVNNDAPIYICVPQNGQQFLLKNRSKYAYFSNPYNISGSIIFKAQLIQNTFSPDLTILRNSSSIDALLVGRFMGSENDQLLQLGRNFKNSQNEDRYMQILDFINRSTYGEDKYNINYTEIEYGINNTLLTGDFMDLGYDQILYINKDSNPSKVVIRDFSQGKSAITIKYMEVAGDNSTLKDLVESDNVRISGDFLGLGYSQVLFLNRNFEEGIFVIADFSKRKTAEITEITGIDGNFTVLNSLLDKGDKQIAGDFLSLGHSQVLFMNCNHTKAEKVMIIIVDIGKKRSSASVGYLENWGDSSLFGGWLDANDTQLVGDFTGCNHSQLLLVNHHRSGGKISIADFSLGKPPAVRKYAEGWGRGGALFERWLDINDIKVAGDFKGLGYSQVLFLNASINGSNVAIIDFKNGNNPLNW